MICTLCTHIEFLIATGVSNARTEPSNTAVKKIERTGCGSHNAKNYRIPSLLIGARGPQGEDLPSRPVHNDPRRAALVH